MPVKSSFNEWEKQMEIIIIVILFCIAFMQKKKWKRKEDKMNKNMMKKSLAIYLQERLTRKHKYSVVNDEFLN